MKSEQIKNVLLKILPVETIERVRVGRLDFDALPPILIYQPGKVGSSSVYYSLKSSIKNPVFHVHNMTEKGLERIIKNLEANNLPIYHHIIISNILLQKFKAESINKIYIITLVREPINWILSGIFQNLERLAPNLYTKGQHASIEELTKFAQDFISRPNEIVQFADNWFKNELEAFSGIDILSEEYQHQNGYTLAHNKEFSVLLFRLEDLDQSFSEGITSLLGSQSSDISLKKINIGNEKWYASMYQKVKNNLKIDKVVLEQICEARFVQKYYSSEHQNIFNKWSM